MITLMFPLRNSIPCWESPLQQHHAPDCQRHPLDRRLAVCSINTRNRFSADAPLCYRSIVTVGAAAAETASHSPSARRSSRGRSSTGYVTVLDDDDDGSGEANSDSDGTKWTTQKGHPSIDHRRSAAFRHSPTRSSSFAINGKTLRDDNDQEETNDNETTEVVTVITQSCHFEESEGWSEGWYEVDTNADCANRSLSANPPQWSYTRMTCPTNFTYSKLIQSNDLDEQKGNCAQLVLFSDTVCGTVQSMQAFPCAICSKAGTSSVLPFCDPVIQNLTLMSDCNSDCSICWNVVDSSTSFPESTCVDTSNTDVVSGESAYNMGIASCQIYRMEEYSDSECTQYTGSSYHMQYTCDITGNYTYCSNAQQLERNMTPLAALTQPPYVMVNYCYDSGSTDYKLAFYIPDGDCYPRNDGTSAQVECALSTTFCVQLMEFHDSQTCGGDFSLAQTRECDSCILDYQPDGSIMYAYITDCNVREQTFTMWRKCSRSCDISTCEYPNLMSFADQCVSSPLNASDYGVKSYGVETCRYVQVSRYADQQCSPAAFQDRFTLPQGVCDGYANYRCEVEYAGALMGTCGYNELPLQFVAPQMCTPLLTTQNNSPFASNENTSSSFLIDLSPKARILKCHDLSANYSSGVCAQIGICTDETCSEVGHKYSLSCGSCVRLGLDLFNTIHNVGIQVECNFTTGDVVTSVCDSNCDSCVDSQAIPIGSQADAGPLRFINNDVTPCDPLLVEEYSTLDCSGDPTISFTTQSGVCLNDFVATCFGGTVSAPPGDYFTYQTCDDQSCRDNCNTGWYRRAQCIPYLSDTISLTPPDEAANLYTKVTCEPESYTCAQVAEYYGPNCGGEEQVYESVVCNTCTYLEFDVYQFVECHQNTSTLNVSFCSNSDCSSCFDQAAIHSPIQVCNVVDPEEDGFSLYVYSIFDCTAAWKRTYADPSCSEESHVIAYDVLFPQGICNNGTTLACPTTNEESSGNNTFSLSGGAILGIVLAGVAVLVGIVAGVILYRRYQQRRAAEEAAEAADWEKILVRM